MEGGGEGLTERIKNFGLEKKKRGRLGGSEKHKRNDRGERGVCANLGFLGKKTWAARFREKTPTSERSGVRGGLSERSQRSEKSPGRRAGLGGKGGSWWGRGGKGGLRDSGGGGNAAG